MSEPVNVICMKWGTLYGPEYANRLYAMVARNLHRPFRFMCFTDDPTGLRSEIETTPIPDLKIDPPYENTPWRKLAIYYPELGGLSGSTLFLDLDVVVVGDIGPMFDLKGDYCVIHNWTHPNRIVGNTSVFRFEIGAHADIIDLFLSQPTQHWVDKYRIEQTFLSHELPELTYWPADWCVSFKRHCLPGGLRPPKSFLNWVIPSRLPDGARIVIFHGHPNPDEAYAGEWPGGWYKRLLPAKWIGDYWTE